MSIFFIINAVIIIVGMIKHMKIKKYEIKYK